MCDGLGSGNKTYRQLAPLDENGKPDTDSPLTFNKSKGFNRLCLGSVYAIESEANVEGRRTFYMNTIQYQRKMDHDFCIEQNILQRALDISVAAFNQQKKTALDHDSILERLRPLRAAYSKTNAVGKMAIEVRLLSYLRNEKGL